MISKENKIKHYRENVCKLTQEQASEIAGVSLITWRKIEWGKDCYLSTALVIAKTLGVSIDELWSLPPEEQSNE